MSDMVSNTRNNWVHKIAYTPPILKYIRQSRNRCGIAVSTASRYGTKDFTGEEPGGRRPSIDKAIEFANAIGLDVEAAFGDLPPTKKREATKGSGGGRFDLYQRGAK